jgi:hypothetical protein
MDESGVKRLNEGFNGDSRNVEIPVGLDTQPRNAWTHAIARSRSGVGVAYCSRKPISSGIRQVYNIISVEWDDPLVEPLITSIAEIAAEDASGHVLYTTFVETDRVELSKANPSDAALLYWVQTSGSKFFTRGLMMHGTTDWSSPFALSTERWAPGTNNFAIGDYMKGAFYYDGSLNFLALWPEVTAAGQECCYRVISVTADGT